MYLLDTRNIVILIYSKLKSLRKVALLTNISKSTISRWNIVITPVKRKSKYDIIRPLIIDIISTTIKLNPFFTILDIQNHVKMACNINCSYGIIRSVIKKMNLTYKKTKFINCPNKINIKSKTDLFIDKFKKLYNCGTTIASIDEVGFSSKINPLFSWSTKGKPNYISITTPLKNRNNTSVCSCITNKGDLYYKIKDGSFNKNSFLEFFKSLNLPKNTIILLDNVKFHHSKCILEHAKQQNWILLHVPPYSPWFNPIENIFSVIKNNYRKFKNIYNAFNIVTKTMITKSILSAITKIKTNYFIF